MASDAVQLSVAVDVPALPSEQSKVTLDGQVMSGAVWSLITMVCVAMLVLPHASVALKVLITVPEQSEPVKGPSLQVMTGTEQLSEAVALVGLHVGMSAEHWTVIFAGAVMAGNSLSTICMVRCR